MGNLTNATSDSFDGTSRHDASIGELIHWLRGLRRRDPALPLSQILNDQPFSPNRLIDIACIDLMERRRLGRAVTTEDYLKDLPSLATESNTLDLIDAELCILHELGTPARIDEYEKRFPSLAVQVRELIELAADPAPMSGSEDFSIGEFSVEITPQEREPHRQNPAAPYPVEVPDWFVGEHCVASAPGRWLIRGRDSVRGTSLALKVTELPAQLTTKQSNQILDACEMASKVRNPGWVLPSVAAIQQRHLGVIRPWLFARPWQQVMSTLDHNAQLRQLANVAFTIASAHQTGATHGGLHSDNLMLDHEGQTHVTDAASSRAGLAKWMSGPGNSDDEIAPLDQRIDADVKDLVKLIAAASVEWPAVWAQTLIGDLPLPQSGTASNNELDVCYQIGQRLIEQADQDATARSGARVPDRRSWRFRLARWLTKNQE